MPKIQHYFAVFTFIFLFSTFVNSQQIPPSYGFVEVVDSNNRPVADASVCWGDCEKISKNEGRLLEKTNQNGLMEKGIQISGGYRLPFSIYKDGYYPFINCFQLFKDLFGGFKNNKNKPLKIELLKIPNNKTEKKLIEKEQQKRELFLAIYKNDTDSLRKLLKLKVNPNLTTSDLRGVPVSESIPAIIYAADLANIEAIKELLSAGVDVSAKNSATNNILLNYLRTDTSFYSPTEEERKQKLSNYENGVETLINAGANIYVRDEQDKSLLLIAAEKGYLRIVETLLKNGLSGNEKNQKDLALITAVWRGSYENRFEIAQLLLKNGANPNFLIDEYNYNYQSNCASALILATEYSDLQTVELLIANGADVNLTCKNGESVFSKALSPRFNYYDKSAEEKREKILNLLFASGLDVKAVDSFGATSLMKAVERSNYPITARLIKMGVPVNAKTKRGETALLIAASSRSKGIFDIVKLLIESGANVNEVNEYTENNYGKTYNFCYTPLINATLYSGDSETSNEMTDVMQLLVAKGANVNFKCSSDETPLTIAARSYSVTGLKKLIELGADVRGEQGTLALKYAKEGLQESVRKKYAEQMIAILEAAGAK